MLEDLWTTLSSNCDFRIMGYVCRRYTYCSITYRCLTSITFLSSSLAPLLFSCPSLLRRRTPRAACRLPPPSLLSPFLPPPSFPPFLPPPCRQPVQLNGVASPCRSAAAGCNDFHPFTQIKSARNLYVETLPSVTLMERNAALKGRF